MAMVERSRGCSSTRVTPSPSRAASMAAEAPEAPAPTTTTSSLSTRSPRRRGSQGRRRPVSDAQLEEELRESPQSETVIYECQLGALDRTGVLTPRQDACCRVAHP